MKIPRFVKFLFPCLVAWSTNRRIKNQSQQVRWKTLFDKWEKRIDVKKIKIVEKIVNDLYQSEIRRKEAIESKATSLFGAVGFAISLVSAAIIFANKTPLLIISLFSIVNFILSGICSWHATKLGEFSLPTLESVEENLGLAEEKMKTYTVVEKLADVEMNFPLILIKSNWLFAAYQHFLFGILLLIGFLAIIISEPYFRNILGLLNNALL